MKDHAEWRMLKQLCVMPLARSSDTWMEEWLSPLNSRLADSTALVNLAVRHKLTGALAVVTEHPHAKATFAPHIRDLLRTYRNANRVRNRVLTAEAIQIVDRLHALGVPVTATKGVVLHHLVYRGDGSRRLSDIDFMIHPDNRQEVSAELRKLGLAFGTYDRAAHRIEPLGRKDELLYRVYPDHLPHALKLRDDPLVPFVMVDCAFSLTWFQAPWQIDMQHALENPMRVELNDNFASARMPQECITSLSAPFLWLFTVLHLFRESWIARDAMQGAATLAQYRDVVQLWRALTSESRAAVRLAISNNRTIFPVTWVCEHADRILGTTLCAELNLGKPMPEELLNTGLGPRETILNWHGTMEQRLSSEQPPEFFASANIRLEDLGW
ncbi:nucleotidyltransferase family protein [Nocardia sp. NPDC051321]|uniref:nucleotidyltransferase family protein n=1 Tax=Nocardia sp. NPDC051321 TaxID=3364323 RepID=UPI0037A3CBE2